VERDTHTHTHTEERRGTDSEGETQTEERVIENEGRDADERRRPALTALIAASRQDTHTHTCI